MKSDWWSYTDESDPSLPSWLIRCKVAMPYIFKIESCLFWSGFSINIHFLILSVGFISNVSCGKYVHLKFVPWGLSFTLSRGWQFAFFIGIQQLTYLMWRVRRKTWRNAKQGKKP